MFNSVQSILAQPTVIAHKYGDTNTHHTSQYVLLDQNRPRSFVSVRPVKLQVPPDVHTPLPPLCYTIHEFQVKNNQGKFVLMSLRDLRSNNMTGTGDRRDWESTLLSLLFKCWPWGSTVPLQETPARRPTLHQVNKLTFTFFLRSITRHSVSKL